MTQMPQDHGLLHRELDDLRRIREELRLETQLGQMDSRDLWTKLEDRFNSVEANAKRSTLASGDALEGLANATQEGILELRCSYDEVRTTLNEAGPSEHLPDRLRSTIERWVKGSRTTVQQVSDSLKRRGLSARLNVEKARLSRTRQRRCAALGARVCELAREPALPDGTPPPVSDDRAACDLLRELDSLDAELQRIQADLLKSAG